jgi:hypothetical protein
MMPSEQYDVMRKNLGVFQKQKQWTLQWHSHFVVMWQVYVYFAIPLFFSTQIIQ